MDGKYSIQEIDFILNCDAENNPYCDSTIQSEIKQALFPLNNEEIDFFWFDIIEKLFNCNDCEQFLDENGVIVARNLRGAALYKKIEELLSNI